MVVRDDSSRRHASQRREPSVRAVGAPPALFMAPPLPPGMTSDEALQAVEESTKASRKAMYRRAS